MAYLSIFFDLYGSTYVLKKCNIILLILLGNIGVMYFIRLIGAPEWYATVFVGLSFSNYMLFTVPNLRKKVETLGEDPDFVSVRDN